MREVPGSIPGAALLPIVSVRARLASGITMLRMFSGAKHCRACGVVVSRLLCMQKAPGSNPGESSIVFWFREALKLLGLVN